MKCFIITIDTEGDNLWDYKPGDSITTENSRYIPRFQDLCERYGYKPVYLVNHEMANDGYFRDFAVSSLKQNNCEIGIHPHAWNSPPYYELDDHFGGYGPPYLTEYPLLVMRQKFAALFDLITERFQYRPESHRAGRWTMNQDYFDILIDHGIKIDASVTPHISWKSSMGHSTGGSDYRRSGEEPFPVKHSSGENTLTEIPVTIRKIRYNTSGIEGSSVRNFLVLVRNVLFGKTIWLRPNGRNLSEMMLLIDHVRKSESGYIMFMLHSSELMPGGSPAFRTADSIEKLFQDIKTVFKKISGGFTGKTLRDYHALSTGINGT
jgi:hypothetical protein